MQEPQILYDIQAKPRGVAFDKIVDFYKQTFILVYDSSTGKAPIVLKKPTEHKVILQDTKISTTMNTYLGVKKIKAGLPITRKEYCAYRGWEVPENENPDDMVYLVEYEPEPGKPSNHPLHKGYISMSPADVFDTAYKRTDFVIPMFAEDALLPHQERVVEEATELQSKTMTLKAFIEVGEIFPTIDKDEQERLVQQSYAMQYYLTVLVERIKNFN